MNFYINDYLDIDEEFLINIRSYKTNGNFIIGVNTYSQIF